MSILKSQTSILGALLLLTLSSTAFAFEKNDKDAPPLEIYGAKFTVQDRDGDNIYDGLRANVTIKTSCIGQYAFNASLESVNGAPISSSPMFEYSSPVQDPSLSFHAELDDEPRSIQVTFSGEDIRRANISNVYILKIMNMGQVICNYGVNPYKTMHVRTPSYNPTAFGENCGSPPRPCANVYK